MVTSEKRKKRREINIGVFLLSQGRKSGFETFEEGRKRLRLRTEEPFKLISDKKSRKKKLAGSLLL